MARPGSYLWALTQKHRWRTQDQARINRLLAEQREAQATVEALTGLTWRDLFPPKY